MRRMQSVGSLAGYRVTHHSGTKDDDRHIAYYRVTIPDDEAPPMPRTPSHLPR